MSFTFKFLFIAFDIDTARYRNRHAAVMILLGFLGMGSAFAENYHYADGTVWAGEIKNGVPNGFGKLTSPTGQTYEGNFKNNKRRGFGRSVFPDGSIYEGQHRNDKVSGFGKYILADGTTYIGSLRDGKFEGIGKLVLADGSLVEGRFRDGHLVISKRVDQRNQLKRWHKRKELWTEQSTERGTNKLFVNEKGQRVGSWNENQKELNGRTRHSSAESYSNDGKTNEGKSRLAGESSESKRDENLNYSGLETLTVFVAIAVLLTFFFLKRFTSTSTYIGRKGEERIVKKLNRYKAQGGKVLTNLFIPMFDNKVTEVDIVLIHPKGFFVFESKNYSGWIFGSDSSDYWTQTLPVGPGRPSHRVRFYSPLQQNRTHIKYLKQALGEHIQMLSVIVFSDHCTFKNMTLEKNAQYRVIQLKDLEKVVSEMMNIHGADVFTENEVEVLFNSLLAYKTRQSI